MQLGMMHRCYLCGEPGHDRRTCDRPDPRIPTYDESVSTEMNRQRRNAALGLCVSCGVEIQNAMFVRCGACRKRACDNYYKRKAKRNEQRGRSQTGAGRDEQIR